MPDAQFTNYLETAAVGIPLGIAYTPPSIFWAQAGTSFGETGNLANELTLAGYSRVAVPNWSIFLSGGAYIVKSAGPVNIPTPPSAGGFGGLIDASAAGTGNVLVYYQQVLEDAAFPADWTRQTTTFKAGRILVQISAGPSASVIHPEASEAILSNIFRGTAYPYGAFLGLFSLLTTAELVDTGYERQPVGGLWNVSGRTATNSTQIFFGPMAVPAAWNVTARLYSTALKGTGIEIIDGVSDAINATALPVGDRIYWDIGDLSLSWGGP